MRMRMRPTFFTFLTMAAASAAAAQPAEMPPAGATRPVLASTAIYGLATTATRNPALLLASLPMGLLFAQQRRITGGIQASMLTHVVWSALMLRYLPPLFARRLAEERSSPE